jgi:hypothetical protein
MKLYLPLAIATQRPTRTFLLLAVGVALLWCPAVLGDTLVLTNGDKLTGEIRKLDDGDLSIKLAYSDDPLVMDWKVVSSVTTEKPLKVTLDDGKEITGKLEPAKEPGQFLAAGNTAPLELKSVVKVVPAEPKPLGFEDRFATANSITYQYTGTSDLRNLTWYTNIAYYGDKWEPLLLLAQNLNAARGLKTSGISYGVLSVNYYLTKHVFLYPWLAGEKLKVADVGYGSSVQAGGGVGWAFNRLKNHRLLLQGGFVADKDTLSLSPPNQNPNLPDFKSSNIFPAGMVAFNWYYSPNDNVTVKTRFVYYRALESNVRNPNQIGTGVQVDLPIHGPVSLTFQAQDYANPLGTTSLSKKTLNLSSGIEISY